MNLFKRNQLRAKVRMLSIGIVCGIALSAPIQALASEQLPAAPSKPLTAETAAAFLDEFFASEQAKPHFIGASVAIVKDGETIALEGYGYADAEEQKEVDPEETVFRAASVSKTVTAMAVMQLAEQGKIDLHEDISAYLPGLRIDNPFDEPVRVEHLLTHQSGFEVRDPRKEDLHADFERYTPIEDYVKTHMPPVVRKPGTSYLYDNFAYLLLGLIVQNASGEPFELYMKTRLFEPLGMDRSSYVLEKELMDRLATGYDAQNQPIEPYAFTPTVMPHGSMLTTAADMSKLMIAFLDGGKTPNGNILSESSVSAMTEYRSTIHPLMPNTGYGFEAPAQLPLAGSSGKILTKVGDLPGNSSFLMLIPDEQLGVFLTYNKTGVLRDLFYQQFIAEFLPEYAAPAELGTFEPDSPEQLKHLEGLYSDLRMRSIVSSVKVSGPGTLTISDALLGTRVLRQAGENLFIDELMQKYTAFQVDLESGEVYMKEPYLNPLGYARKGDSPLGFTDVDESDAYAPYILAMQSLGHYPNEAGASFQPDQPVTRAEYVYRLLTVSGLAPSDSTDYAFQDIEGHPLAAYIQAAHELGMVTGEAEGIFSPDRPVTRQEAAVAVWNVYKSLFPDVWFSGVKLEGQTDDWAIPAVKMMTALGYHGPEVERTEDGAADYRSLEPLTREQEAALMHQMLFQPVEQIISGLLSQQEPGN